jgi:hypothetical protein
MRLFLQETIELWGKNEGAREGGMKELEMQGSLVNICSGTLFQWV